MILFQGPWMARAGCEIIPTYKLGSTPRKLCASALEDVLGVKLTNKDEEIRVSIFSEYVRGSHEMVLRRQWSASLKVDLWDFKPSLRSGYTHGTEETDAFFEKSRKLSSFIPVGKQQTVYLLTETREV
jgi:hypothetical protein